MLDVKFNSLAGGGGGGGGAVRCVRDEKHSSLSSSISGRFGGLVNVIGRHILEFSAESL